MTVKKWFANLIIVLTLALLGVLASPALAFAATTATVAVNATPAFVTISCNPTSYSFGVVNTSTNYSTTTGYFTITNGSTVTTDVTIACNATWAGGTGWTHSDAGTAGADTVALYSSKNTGAWNIIVKNASPNKISASQSAGGTFQWELRIVTPTSYSDGVIKTNTVTLTSVAI
jgi:hypothetical protein